MIHKLVIPVVCGIVFTDMAAQDTENGRSVFSDAALWMVEAANCAR